MSLKTGLVVCAALALAFTVAAQAAEGEKKGEKDEKTALDQVPAAVKAAAGAAVRPACSR